MKMVPQPAHRHGRDGAGHADGHDVKRRGDLGLLAEVADAQREDEREHDGHEQKTERQEHPREHFDVGHRHEDDEGIGDAVNRQHEVRLDDLRDGRPAEASDGVKDEREGDDIGRRGVVRLGVGQVLIPGKERSRGRISGRVFDDGVLHDVIHRKRADANLRNDVEELREHAPFEMRQA